MRESLLPCPFCGGEPEEDAGGCIEYYGHERQDYSISCNRCGAEVYCAVGTFEKADAPCSCHHDTRKICVDKWNMRPTAAPAVQAEQTKRLIGWRTTDYTEETSDPEMAKNWAAAVGVLPIFEGDINTRLPAEQLSGNTEQVEHVSAANKLGGWIPVSERMPETMTSVLVTGTWFHHAVSFWDGASWCDLDYEPPVTHWMPLPAAPKQEAV